MTIKLRDDQLLLVEQVIHRIDEHNMVVSPSGSGKSYMLVYLEKLLTDQGYNVNVYAPTIEVRDQINGLMASHGSDNHVRNIVVDLRSEDIEEPDYLLIDEAHHSEAATYQQLFEKFPNATRIGFSATPKRLDGKGFEDTFDNIVIGKSVRELIDNHVLSDFRYYAPSISSVIHNSVSEKYLNVLGEKFFQAVSRDRNYTKKIYADVVETWLKFGEDKQTILFAPSIKMSNRFVEAFRQIGIKAKHIDGMVSLSERNKIISDFRQGKIKLLSNVDLISEGFDMSNADCVILTRPTESLAMFMQQAFRALRYRDGKTAIILDHADNISLHGALDQHREWELTGKNNQGENSFFERTIWDRWNNNAVFDTSVELSEVIKDYYSVYDNLIEKALALKNIEGFKLLVEIEKQAKILSVGEYSWSYAFALKHNFDIPRMKGL